MNGCVLSGRGLCDELITHPEESYRLWCVVVCDLKTSRDEEVMTRVGRSATAKQKRMFNTAKSYAIFNYVEYKLWRDNNRSSAGGGGD
jgi:hypothetical protein